MLRIQILGIILLHNIFINKIESQTDKNYNSKKFEDIKKAAYLYEI